MSLRTRLALFAALVVLAAVILDALLQQAVAGRALDRGRRELAHGVADTLAKTIAFVAARDRERPTDREDSPDVDATEPRNLDLDRLDLDLLIDDLLAGRRETAGSPVAVGDLREVRVLDARLGTVVGRSCDATGTRTDTPAALDEIDAALARDCLAAGHAVGRADGGVYRAAAPVRLQTGGAVVVAVAPAAAGLAAWWPLAAAGAAAVAAGLAAVAAAAWLARSPGAALGEATTVAGAVAAGDLGGAVVARGGLEERRLGAAVAAMTAAVAAAGERVRRAASRLAAAEGEVAAAFDRQGRAGDGVRGAARGVTASARGIARTADELLAATGEVAGVARDASRTAAAGRSGLAGMSESMHALDEAMNAFNRKLATISQRAAGVTAVVTTIAKVADQTNLLSVNATIEAEKAGEAGRGFRIVAQEIRRLADQTALATKDIERLVRDMQAAVAGGTTEMDRFRGEVSHRIGEVAGVGEKLGGVLAPVEAVARSLEQVHGGMETLSRHAREVSDGLGGLDGEAAGSAAAAAEISAALDEVRGSIAELAAAAAWFRTEPGISGGS
jgi:methyl-accepting chemotaxis protein